MEFYTLDELNNHTRSVHEEMKKCPFCEIVVISRDLQKHISTVHNVELANYSRKVTDFNHMKDLL